MESTHILFLVNLYPKELVGERVDYNQDISKLCLEDGPAVVPPVFTPHNMDLIIS